MAPRPAGARALLFAVLVPTLLASSACSRAAPSASVPPQPSPVTGTGTGVVAVTPDLRVVSRQDEVPGNYVPDRLVPLSPEAMPPGVAGVLVEEETRTAMIALRVAALQAGLDVRVASGYRAPAHQQAVLRGAEIQYGPIEAARRFAPPGYSEHQLGTAVDLTVVDADGTVVEDWAATPAAEWLARHAPDVGFALSYPPGSEAVTGTAPEPWHFRYVGVEHARRTRDSGEPLLTYLRGLLR